MARGSKLEISLLDVGPQETNKRRRCGHKYCAAKLPPRISRPRHSTIVLHDRCCNLCFLDRIQVNINHHYFLKPMVKVTL
ncbi:hypothetical protein BDN71DRAFT_804525 [Pleurotus eryngii]|uniref:Uncharacterized protein n=1 Tax=Pleurotus eryngii TaxID=5323 RepID=A0A9P5ZWR3_PLEER|nr:hypothetical protein BDN71DRAFT_804525 [Pleurotus eryngii]